MNAFLDLQVIGTYVPQYVLGVQVTLLLLALSLATGLLLSVPLAVARVSAAPWLSRPVWLFTYVMRGTPLLVQLFLIYRGLGQFDWIRESAAWTLLRSPLFCAWLAFALNTTAYTTEIIAGALRATPAGELEAARSYGLGGFRLYAHILLPGALRRALPQYSNEAVGMLHATAIAGTVTLVDITQVARDIYADHLLPAEAFGSAAVIYLLLTFGLVGIFKLLERRYLRHLRTGEASTQSAAPRAVAPHA